MPDFLILPIIVLLFIVLDIITGVTQAIQNKDVSSSKLRQGAFHKFSYILILTLAYLIEYSMGFVDLGFNIPIVNGVCIYLILTEIVSIMENIIKMNPGLENSKIWDLFRNDNVLKAELKENKENREVEEFEDDAISNA